MPWSVVRRGSKYCVKADADGATVACHDTARQARKHQQALYANEPQKTLKRKFQRNVGGGVDRDKLDASDFVLSDERTFPIVKPGDVQDAVSSWGRYRGPTSFEEFKRRLTALARRKGPEFVAQLPKAWETEEKAKEEEEEEHTGAMVAFFIPDEEAGKLALSPNVLPPGSNPLPAEELHLTLAYLGDLTQPELAAQKNVLLSVLSGFAKVTPAIRGTVGGIGRFLHDEGNGTNAFYASFDASDLPAWRQALTQALGMAGVEYAQNHGFTPHITLAYIPVGADTPTLDIPQVELAFDSVALAWGSEVTRFPLARGASQEEEEGVTVKATAGDDNRRSGGGVGYGARAGQTIRGRLVRGSDGKFSSSGAPSSSSSATPKRGPTLRQRLAAQRSAARQQRRAAAKKPAAGRGGGKGEAQREAERQRKRLEQEADRQKRRAEAEADRKKRRAEQEADRQKREAERAARAGAGAKPAKAGGGGGKGGAEKPDASQAKRDNRREVEDALAKAGLSREDYDALSDFYDGEEVTPARLAGLVAQGLAVADSSGGYRLTPAARGLMQAAGAGNVRRAVDALSSGRDRARREAERAARQRKEAGGFAVFKQANGLYRWVSFSSNAYRDRDGEIISTKALEEDCARADALGEYGPLRWWHVPGLELGTCDFNAVVGRVLIESGTFFDERVGAFFAAKAKGLGTSIGFVHPKTQPDAERVFHTIIRFERSPLPAGHASNPFTKFAAYKQENMRMLKEKLAELIKLFDGDEELVRSVVSSAEATQKELDAIGVAFKAVGEGSEDAGTSEEAEAEVKADGEMDEEALPDVLLVGDMTPEEFTQMLSESLAGALAPLLEAVNVESKMAAHLGELKDMIGGYAKKKDDESAEQAGQVTALQEALVEMKEAHERQVTEQQATHAQKVAALEAKIEAKLKEAATGIAELRGGGCRTEGGDASGTEGLQGKRGCGDGSGGGA